MTAILQALQSGHTPQKILDFIKKLDPAMAAKISLALQAGHSIEQILGFLTKGGNAINKALGSPQPNAGNLYEQAVSNVHPAVGPIAKTALAAGAAIASPFALSALGRALPAAAQQMLGIPGAANPAGSQAAAAALPAISQPAKAAITPGAGASLLSQMGDKVIGVIQSLAGKEAPEAIASVLEQHILTSGQKKWLSDQGIQDLPGLIKDFLSQSPQSTPPETAAQNPEKAAQNAPPPGNLSENAPPQMPIQTNEAPQKPQIAQSGKIEAGADAQLPSGDIGKVEEIKNGIAKVIVDGKERHVKAEELETPPLPEKDLADLLQDLLKGIEKHTGQEISRMASFVGYDPEANELAFRAHTGASYTFDNIDPEDVELLKSQLVQRKTTGENYIGAWGSGTKSPIGAAMSKLIQKYRERAAGGKPHIRKFETIYSSDEPAHLALKKKKAEQAKAAKGERPKKERKKTKKPTA